MSKLKFRSGLESAIHEKLNDTFLYEPYRLPYTYTGSTYRTLYTKRRQY